MQGEEEHVLAFRRDMRDGASKPRGPATRKGSFMLGEKWFQAPTEPRRGVAAPLVFAEWEGVGSHKPADRGAELRILY